MISGEALRRLFNIHKGEEKPVGLLVSYSFVMGIAYAFLFTISTTLFLNDFKVGMIPYAYMAGGVLSYLVWVLYAFFEKRAGFPLRLKTGTLFLLITLSALVFGYLFTASKVFAFLLFVWVNVFLFINGVGFWGIASKLFNLQQGKRLFGLVGSGEIFAKAISFLSVPVLVKYTPAKNLLYVCIAGLLLCHLLMARIIAHFRDKLEVKKTVGTAGEGEKGKGFLEILKNRYLLYMFILAMLPLFAAYFVDFIFLDQTKLQFKNAKLVSTFLGYFFGFMAVSEFVLKTFISGRLITRYGILFSLLTLPLMLLLTTLSASIYGSLFGITAMFFSFIALSKLFVRIFRTAFLDPSFQILYQPIPVAERLSFQSKIEGVPKSLGNVFAGVVLAVFANLKSLTTIHYNFILLAVLVFWAWISYKLYHEYRHLLKRLLQGKRVAGTKEVPRVFTEETVEQALDVVTAADAGIHSWQLVKETCLFEWQDIAKQVLNNNEYTVGSKNLLLEFLMQTGGDDRVSAILDDWIKHNPDHALVAKAKETLKLLINTAGAVNTERSKWLQATAPEQRMVAALSTPDITDENVLRQHITLLKDPQPLVRNAALLRAGQLDWQPFRPYIVREMDRKESAYYAFQAVKANGEDMLEELLRFSRRSDHQRYTRSFIQEVLLTSGKPALQYQAWQGYTFADGEGRQRILRLLHRNGFKVPTDEFVKVKQLVTEEVNLVCWFAAAINDLQQASGDYENVLAALEEELHSKRINVFLMLSLIYDSSTVDFLIQKTDTDASDMKAYAIEILDMTVSEDMKEVLLPLLAETSHEGLLKAYRHIFYHPHVTAAERLWDIINKDCLLVNEWTKATAMAALRQLDAQDQLLIANLQHPSLFIKEMAWTEMLRVYPDRLHRVLLRYPEVQQTEAQKQIAAMQTDGWISMYNKIRAMKVHRAFGKLPYTALIRLVEQSEELRLSAGAEKQLLPGDASLTGLLLSGRLQLQEKGGVVKTVDAGAYLYYKTFNGSSVVLKAMEDLVLIQIPDYEVAEMLYWYPANLSSLTDSVAT